MKTIKDEYGKKIGGSKRDLWKVRGLILQDLEDMNDAEKESFIKKDNVWKKPDYQSMKKDGANVEIIYYIKLIRDGVAVKPVRAVDYEAYIERTRDIMDKAMSLVSFSTLTGAREQMLQHLKENGYAKSGYFWSLEEKMRVVGGSKLFKAIATNESKIRSAVKERHFLYSEEETKLAAYTFIEKKGCYSAERFKDWEGGSLTDCKLKNATGWTRISQLTVEQFDSIPENSVLILRGRTYISFAGTLSEAKERVLEFENAVASITESSVEQKKRKKKFVPEQLADVKRKVNGVETIRPLHVNGDDYIDNFSFHGIEFGNYMTELDRQASLDMGYDAFEDLAKALSVSCTDISLNGELSVAFGARGSGNEAAHYEPMRRVINLTKMRGAGNLAHEYGHALDFILGAEHTGRTSFSEAGRLQRYPAFENVKDVMKKKKNGNPTDFYMDALAFDSVHSKDAKGYWHSDVELFARAFACFVKDELAEQGIRNDYLCGHADTGVSINANGDTIYAFPRGEERENINKAMRVLVDTLILDGLLPCTLRHTA